MARSFSLSWKRFSLLAAMLLAMPAFILYGDFKSGNLDVTDASIPLFCVSLLGFFAFRWAQMRVAFAAGEFTEADFLSNPMPILMGRPAQAAVWLGISFLLAILPIAWWAYGHWPKA